MSDTPETVVVNHSEFPLPPDVHDWPGIRVVECQREGEIPADVDGDVVLTRTDGGPNLADLLARSPRWVHTIGTGVDSFPFDALQGQTLTCSRGISGELIGEWVVAQMLAFAKAMPEVYLDAAPASWNSADPRVGTLRGRTVVVLGMGGIGTEVARLALALGMRVIGVRRRGTDAPHPEMTVVNDIRAVIGEADHVVIAAPSTPETDQMFDAELLAAMKPGVHLCNVARGTL
ncbi:MAG: NAD(P)-dependent oxidoreductase, partial [Actinomycetota bacterium]